MATTELYHRALAPESTTNSFIQPFKAKSSTNYELREVEARMNCALEEINELLASIKDRTGCLVLLCRWRDNFAANRKLLTQQKLDLSKNLVAKEIELEATKLAIATFAHHLEGNSQPYLPFPLQKKEKKEKLARPAGPAPSIFIALPPDYLDALLDPDLDLEENLSQLRNEQEKLQQEISLKDQNLGPLTNTLKRLKTAISQVQRGINKCEGLLVQKGRVVVDAAKKYKNLVEKLGLVPTDPQVPLRLSSQREANYPKALENLSSFNGLPDDPSLIKPLSSFSGPKEALRSRFKV
ncbi:MAG: hypothetical protein LBE38_05745 [Deltaproteobacteria bacterium]|jgi:predicted  nucleic acid-binding Zn-ribbon protein|nr:hypothetical protein [Deltaproteobacteria bacterium]